MRQAAAFQARAEDKVAMANPPPQPAAPGWFSIPTLAVLGALAFPGLAWLAMKAYENPRLACAAARGLCAELAPVAVAGDGGPGCPQNTVPLEGGCWIKVEPGPPCQVPSVLKQGRCWVLHTPPPIPNAGTPGPRPIGR